MQLSFGPGQVAVIRTDTLYGLVARAADQGAVETVYRLKGRDFTKPCIVLVPDGDSIGAHGAWVAGVSARYAGPTTVVVPATTEPSWITRGGTTVAYRIPRDAALRALLRKTGPLIAPSANPQGQPPATTIAEARGYFGAAVHSYHDGGRVPPETPPSRIVAIDPDGHETILR